MHRSLSKLEKKKIREGSQEKTIWREIGTRRSNTLEERGGTSNRTAGDVGTIDRAKRFRRGGLVRGKETIRELPLKYLAKRGTR